MVRSAHSDFIGSRMYACLAVTCHLHFWQNDRGLLRATAVTRGWNQASNESKHTKMTLEKNILPPLLPGFELATFETASQCCNRRIKEYSSHIHPMSVAT